MIPIPRIVGERHNGAIRTDLPMKLLLLAEAVRFELTNGCPLPVFKTGAIDHSATLPAFHITTNTSRSFAMSSRGRILVGKRPFVSRRRRAAVGVDQPAGGAGLPSAVVLMPPSTYITSPVMPLARSDSMKAAALPTSSIVTLRRKGAWWAL